MSKHEAVARVEADAERRGFKLDVIETGEARSAEEAARAVGTILARIVKTLVFRGPDSDTAYLILVSGKNRVDEVFLQSQIGEAIERPDADYVRSATGFAIGGVSPFGATGPVTILMDETLFDHPQVYAAAGTPRHVFEAVPLQLRSALGARMVRVCDPAA